MTANAGLGYRLSESVIGLITPSVEAYARRMAPLLVSPDLNGRGGAIFDRNGRAVQPSARLNDSKQIATFLTASTQLAAPRVSISRPEVC